MSKQKPISQRQAMHYRAEMNRLQKEVDNLKRNPLGPTTWLTHIKPDDITRAILKTAERLNHKLIASVNMEGNINFSATDRIK